MMDAIDKMLKPTAVGVEEINPNRARVALEPLDDEIERAAAEAAAGRP